MTAYRRRMGDRRNARLLRSLPPYSKFIPFIMPRRDGADNMFRESFCTDAMDAFIHQLHKEGYHGITIMHVITAAYVRVLAKYPALNRYVAGNRIYAKHVFEVATVVKKSMTLDGEETTIKVELDPSFTLPEVFDKLNTEIEAIKNEPEDNSTERVAGLLCKLPRIVLILVLALIRAGDWMDLLPNALLKASPFHASLMLVNLGSLGITPIFHHLYDFGTLPVIMVFGKKRKINEICDDGQLRTSRYIDLTLTLDERIVDGFYFASVLKDFRRLLDHPERLMEPPKEIFQDCE